VLISDGSGGAIISWIDFATDPRGDIRVNRLVDGSSGTGDFGAGWPDAGVVMCTACANGSENMAKSHCVDGAGGSWVAWTDRRGSTWDIYISHVTSAGAIPATFLPDGLLVVGEVGDQEALTMEHDGAGGAFIAWVDKRDAADDNIYIEHVLANGTLVHGGGGLPVVSLRRRHGLLRVLGGSARRQCGRHLPAALQQFPWPQLPHQRAGHCQPVEQRGKEPAPELCR
jgi:hypothetical protein